MARIPFLAAIAVTGLAGAAIAATPESGTINDDNHSVEWTGGPYLIPNLSPAFAEDLGEEPICEEGVTCDVFRFEVNLSDADLDYDQVVVTVSWNDPIPDDANPVANTPDYDLYLYDDETGARVTSQASAANPEVIYLFPENRKYRLVIIPFADMAEPYAGKVEFVDFDNDSKVLSFFGGALAPALLLPLLAAAAWRRRRAA